MTVDTSAVFPMPEGPQIIKLVRLRMASSRRRDSLSRSTNQVLLWGAHDVHKQVSLHFEAQPYPRNKELLIGRSVVADSLPKLSGTAQPAMA